MGWTYPHGASRRQCIEELTPKERGYGESMGASVFRTLRHCCRGNVLYALHETVKSDGASTKWIGVYLLQRDNRDGSWGYKDMDESMHPYYYNCPVSYLDQADEPFNESAKKWRAEVRRQAQERKEQNAKKPKEGETWALKGCTIPHVKITSARPLRGTYAGTLYRVKKKHLGEKVETVAVAVTVKVRVAEKKNHG